MTAINETPKKKEELTLTLKVTGTKGVILMELENIIREIKENTVDYQKGKVVNSGECFIDAPTGTEYRKRQDELLNPNFEEYDSDEEFQPTSKDDSFERGEMNFHQTW